jgi:hypothetical protein
VAGGTARAAGLVGGSASGPGRERRANEPFGDHVDRPARRRSIASTRARSSVRKRGATSWLPASPSPLPLTTEHVERADLVLVLTDHDALDWSLLEQRPARILDTRNRVKAPEAERCDPGG